MMLLNPMTSEAKSLMILLTIPNVWPANRFFCISYYPTDISAQIWAKMTDPNFFLVQNGNSQFQFFLPKGSSRASWITHLLVC